MSISLTLLCSLGFLFLLPHGVTTFVYSTLQVAHTSCFAANEERTANYLLDEFSIHTGEVVDPYRILNVPREADRNEIKKAYRDLSRRYHPDSCRKDILPGACNNWQEVRDQWERIKLSYEILSNTKTRKRYDRHVVLNDPKAALSRAASEAAWNGVKSVGQIIWGIGSVVGSSIFSDRREEKQGNDLQP